MSHEYHVFYQSINDVVLILAELQSSDFITSLPPVRPELYQCLELPGDPAEALGILRVRKGQYLSTQLNRQALLLLCYC